MTPADRWRELGREITEADDTARSATDAAERDAASDRLRPACQRVNELLAEILDCNYERRAAPRGVPAVVFTTNSESRPMQSNCSPNYANPARVRALARPPYEADDYVPAPMTPQGIADLRERAKVEPWPWNKVLAAHTEWQDANRQTFEAAGDADAESAAMLRRAAAGDAIRQASQNAAEVFISSLGFALELYPDHTRRILRRLVRKEIRRAVIALRMELVPRLEKSEALHCRVVDLLAGQDGDS